MPSKTTTSPVLVCLSSVFLYLSLPPLSVLTIRELMLSNSPSSTICYTRLLSLPVLSSSKFKKSDIETSQLSKKHRYPNPHPSPFSIACPSEFHKLNCPFKVHLPPPSPPFPLLKSLLLRDDAGVAPQMPSQKVDRRRRNMFDDLSDHPPSRIYCPPL